MKRLLVLLVPIVGLLVVSPTAQPGSGSPTEMYGPWSAPVNMGPVVNSKGIDQCVSVSNDGLSLYFSSHRNSAWGPRNLFVSRRDSVGAPWGGPQKVPNVNSGHDESCPALSLDNYALYFASTRPHSCGGSDIYVSQRTNPTDDFGWDTPQNLGCSVNSAAGESTPNFFEDEDGHVFMYFTSSRAGGTDFYESALSQYGLFGQPHPVESLNTQEYSEVGPTVRRDGLEIIFSSDRSGGLGAADLWTSTRPSTSDDWSEPSNLAVLNSSANETGRMAFSYDGTVFYFSSGRPGGYGFRDLYYATRDIISTR